MAKAAEKELPASDKAVPTPSKKMVRDYASNEFVFAVVGHVGSGTTKIATSLAELLNKGSITGDPFDTEIIKARDLIVAWATENRRAIPVSETRNLLTTEQFQDLGDEMRAGGDHAAVANRAIQRIRLIRAQKQKMDDPKDQPVEPDGSRRAYIIDSIRHPAEVELLRRVYREAFVLIGVVCDAEVRLKRLQSEKYSTASKVDILKFMDRDSRASEDHGQRVSDAFHMADYFVDNTIQQLLDDGTGNREWDNPLLVELSRGDGDMNTVLQDVMGLTKVNFNACIFSDGLPVTLRFAEAVGEILTAAPLSDGPPLPFRHYI